MSQVLNYLITARRCEVEELQRLARTAAAGADRRRR